MLVRVKLFAACREAVGSAETEFEVPEGTTVGEFQERFLKAYPKLQQLADSLVVGLNKEYVSPHAKIRRGDEIALLPPVSGGAGERCVVTEEDFSLDALLEEVRAPEAGGVVLFVGTVRSTSQGREVTHLEYEAYQEMAEQELGRLCGEARRRWELERLAIHHRVGRLEVGENIVAIAVSAPHRTHAFEACEWLMTQIKELVPIWKKEAWSTGEAWVEGHAPRPSAPASEPARRQEE